MLNKKIGFFVAALIVLISIGAVISYSESGSLENLNECCNDSLSINTSNECCIVPENQSVKKDELLDHNNTSDDCCK